MKKRRLGKTGLVISEIGMGTMTFGSTCDEKEAFRILDLAFDSGIDFYDTAEIYPVPPKEEYVFRTEEIFGKWMKTKPRDSVILATKVAGPGHGWFVPPIRSGKTGLDFHHISKALEGSLRRLGTDYIDLYQTHWPDPGMSYRDTLEALDYFQKKGTIRYAGCSNETSYGLTKSLWTSSEENLVRYESIQNNFSMLNPRFLDELALVCEKEQVSLLPYSPIGGGVLSGKYNQEKIPEASRFFKYKKEGERQKKMASRFLNSKTLEATAKYLQIAKEIEMSPVAMAVAWSKQHEFVASTLIGANTVEQLKEALEAKNKKLSEETMKRIQEVQLEILYPMG